MFDPVILGLAVRKNQAQIDAVAQKTARKAKVKLYPEGVPGLIDMELLVWPRPADVIVDLIAVNGRRLSTPLSFDFDLPGERFTELQRRPKWEKVECATALEVQRLAPDGEAVVAVVDTKRACFRMICACGRVRYAPRTGLHQVYACRVCTARDRSRKKALQQIRRRKH